MTIERDRSGKAKYYALHCKIGNVNRVFREPVDPHVIETAGVMLAEARAHRRRVDAEIAALVAPRVEDFAIYWRDARYRKGELGRRVASGNHLKQVTGQLNNHILPVIGTLKMDEVRPVDVARVLSSMKAAGPALKNRVINVLKAMFNDAYRYGMNGWLMPTGRPNPTDALRHFDENPEPRPALEPQEIWPFIAAMQGTRSQSVVAAILLSGGERLNEMLWMTADRVDLSGTGAVAGWFRWRPEHCKERKHKTAPIPHQLVPLLMPVLDAARALHPEARLWSGLSEKRVRLDMKLALQKLGIDRDVTPHGLRHTFVQALFLRGYKLEEIQLLTGHRSVDITRGYARGAMQRLDAGAIAAAHAAAVVGEEGP